MTDDTEAIRARLAAATPGLWESVGPTIEQVAGDYKTVVGLEERGVAYMRYDALVVRPEDAEFIAHAPTDVAYLLAENARLSALIDTAKALNEALNTLPARVEENAGNGRWCIHQDCAHWFEKQCDESCKVLAAPDPKGNPDV